MWAPAWPGGQPACLPAAPLAVHSRPPAWDGAIAPGQMQICSRCCSWPGFQLGEFLGLTQHLTKTRRGIGNLAGMVHLVPLLKERDLQSQGARLVLC